jgi:hypothetical protein
MTDPDERDVDDELQKFQMVEDFCSKAWNRTRPFWVTVLIAWVVIMVLCYL